MSLSLCCWFSFVVGSFYGKAIACWPMDPTGIAIGPHQTYLLHSELHPFLNCTHLYKAMHNICDVGIMITFNSYYMWSWRNLMIETKQWVVGSYSTSWKIFIWLDCALLYIINETQLEICQDYSISFVPLFTSWFGISYSFFGFIYYGDNYAVVWLIGYANYFIWINIFVCISTASLSVCLWK